jgi:vacuolar-type H+-ATPase subunit H
MDINDSKTTQSDIDDLFRKSESELKQERVGSTRIRPYGHAKPGPKPKPKPQKRKLRKDESGKYVAPKSGTKGLSIENLRKLTQQTVDEIVKGARKVHNKIVRDAKKKAAEDEKRYREATRRRGEELDKQAQREKEAKETKYSLLVDHTKDQQPDISLKKKPGPQIKWTPQLIEEYKVYQRHEAEKRNKIDADILIAGENLMPVTAQNESEKNRLSLAGFKKQKNLHDKYLSAKKETEINIEAVKLLWEQSKPEHEHEYEVKFFMANQITAACKVCSKEINMSIYDWIKFKRYKNATGEP